MKRFGCLTGILVITLVLVTSPDSVVFADVVPGDVVDKSNWEKAKGLVPEPVLDWLKKGDTEIKVVELNYDPKDYVNPVAKASLEANKGKFDLDANGLFIEKATAKYPEYISGIPFPEVDEKDPKAAEKHINNRYYHGYTFGCVLFPFSAEWVSVGNGYERKVNASFEQFPMDGYPGHEDEPNKMGVERFSLIRVLSPFDIKGTNILLMRYRREKQDTTLAYVPAIRRVRRMSPANRSDSFIGSDICVDDAWGFDGKVVAFDWELVRKQEALLSFLDTEPLEAEPNEYGGWRTSASIKEVEFGYQDKGWQGQPWQPTNLVWAKRPTYVIEMKAKDPYYNYGTQYIWIDAEVSMILSWKIMLDRAERFWKILLYSWQVYKDATDKWRMVIPSSMQCSDSRTNHATIIGSAAPDRVWQYYWKLDRNDYTLGGFQKACK